MLTRGDEAIYSAAFGYANRGWKIRNSLNTRFDTASITKLITAVAALQLIDQGKFSLDTGVIDFLELEGTAISTDVTVFQLLTHSSGIGDDCEEEDGERYEDLWIDKPNYAITTTADFLPQFIHKSPNFEPGKGTRYCNCSYILLGLMIEKVSGISYRDYVRRQIFMPTQMNDSDFLDKNLINANVAEGCDPVRADDGAVVGWKTNIYAFPPIGSPDAGAYVTAADLDRFLRAVQAGQLLSDELTTAFLTPQVHDRKIEDWSKMYGLGLWFYVDQSGHVVCYEKEGINAGVSGRMRYFPDLDINVVLLSNMEEGVWEPMWEIHERVVGRAADVACG